MHTTKTIVIVGGGTAAWMAANLLQQQLAKVGFSCTLIESPNIPTVGVGEGSTPQLKTLFSTLGISESQWMPQCHATYKNGISFKHWSGLTNNDQYFHPFPSAVDKHTARGFLQHCIAKQQGYNVDTQPDRFFLAAHLAKQQLSPKLKTGAIGLNYGYHFDSALLGQYLQKLATQQGVKHIKSTVLAVQQHINGELKSVQLADGQVVSGELFIDCSGFKALLAEQTLGVEFISYKQQLFNDSAVTLPTATSSPLSSQTLATALSHGWAWQIPLTNRSGNGYVFSSDYCSAEQAEVELRQHLNMLDSPLEAKHLKMKVGRLAQHWSKNCLAVGLSQGFIEPLEATALHLVQHTIESFISAFSAGNYSQQHQAQFNQRINARFDGICDYIVCHYKVNGRHDSVYWSENRDNMNISDSLQALLSCWDKGGDLLSEINQQQIAGYYPAVSWYCLLAGYGRFPATQHKHLQALLNLTEIEQSLEQLSQQFISHEQALAALTVG